MRFVLLSSLALAAGLLVATVAFVPEAAGIKVPADFTFEQHQGSPGVVTFSHAIHVEGKGLKCNACHTKVFKMKKGKSGDFTMAAMNEGKFCGACHDGKTAYSVKDKANCEKCHAKK
jgi:c(7)-type cytochrome triheme protein